MKNHFKIFSLFLLLFATSSLACATKDIDYTALTWNYGNIVTQPDKRGTSGLENDQSIPIVLVSLDKKLDDVEFVRCSLVSNIIPISCEKVNDRGTTINESPYGEGEYYVRFLFRYQLNDNYQSGTFNDFVFSYKGIEKTLNIGTIVVEPLIDQSTDDNEMWDYSFSALNELMDLDPLKPSGKFLAIDITPLKDNVILLPITTINKNYGLDTQIIIINPETREETIVEGELLKGQKYSINVKKNMEDQKKSDLHCFAFYLKFACGDKLKTRGMTLMGTTYDYNLGLSVHRKFAKY